MSDALVPSDADVRGFAEMPMEIMRLLDSETWIMCTPEERSAAINLWFRSWVQVPAGSLPDNDRVLAHLSMAGERWGEVREMALRGWAKAEDGRLYHPVVCEKVNKMLSVREQKQKAGSAGGSSRKPSAKRKPKQPGAGAKQPLSECQASDKPLLSSSLHFSSPDENAVATREADDLLSDSLLDAAGQAIDQTRYGFQDLSRPKAWLAAGCDLELDVLPAIRRVCRDKPPMSVKGWVYFDGAVMDAKATRTKPLPIGQPQSSAGRPVKQKIYGRSAIDGDDNRGAAESNRADAAVLDGSEGCGRDEPGISDTRIAGVVRAAVRR